MNNSMITGTLLLTSAGLSTENLKNKFLDVVKDFENKRIAIVTTAANGKENHKYSQSTMKLFTSMNFVCDFVDLETEPDIDFSKYGIIYVCGGNTFFLLKFARETNFKKSVTDLLSRGGLYIGVSAGSIIPCRSVDIANEVEPDPNLIGMTDFTGLGITNLVIHPHYVLESENELKDFEKRHNVEVTRLTNSQAVIIQGDLASIVE
jgi:dipeptidase E